MTTKRKFKVTDNDTTPSTNEGTVIMTFTELKDLEQLTRKELKRVNKLKSGESITIGFYTITRKKLISLQNNRIKTTKATGGRWENPITGYMGATYTGD